MLEERTERALAMLADNVLDDVVELACKLARHRGAQTLKRDDIRLAFKKLYKVEVPIKLHSPVPIAGQVGPPQAVIQGTASQSACTKEVVQPTVISTQTYKNNAELTRKDQIRS